MADAYKFCVVDLASQGDAVARHVRSWPKKEILAWLELHGQLYEVQPFSYVFRAASGLRTGLTFNKNGDLLLIGDHTVYRPRFASDSV